ncbi:tyrosine-type recombinase/integrase [Brachybacterium subflavum]|uniref:tyrosine-type recombinase/integrase n=1 Tax=Brachybacterium subflavum TaxID=2585206 RepID=UPI0012660A0F|nr:site-specific integrase [Brachybacterium subflavum]
MAGKRAFGSIRKLTSGRFQARYTGPDLAVHTAPRTFAKKAYAEAWLASEDQLISSGTWSPPKRRRLQQESAGVTVGEYVEAVIQRRSRRARNPIKQTTADLYRKDWKNRGQEALGDVALTELTSAAVTQWWDSLGSTPAQDGRCYDLLKTVMAEAVEDEIIDRNPCRVRGAGKPEPKRRDDAMTVDEGKRYLEAVTPRYRLALMTCLWCGLRSGEVRGLRRRDVDLETGTLRLEQAVSRVRADDHSYTWRIDGPKTVASYRRVSMPQMMVEPLREHLENAPIKTPDAFVFPAIRDATKPMHESLLRRAHNKGLEAIDKPHLTVHDLRRSAATLAAQGGATTAELMRLLGHTTVTMAMGYQVASDARDRERARRLDEKIRGGDEKGKSA